MFSIITRLKTAPLTPIIRQQYESQILEITQLFLTEFSKPHTPAEEHALKTKALSRITTLQLKVPKRSSDEFFHEISKNLTTCFEFLEKSVRLDGNIARIASCILFGGDFEKTKQPEVLGEGAFGKVFSRLGPDGKPYAFKTFPKKGSSAKEASLTDGLDHPNIVRIYSCDHYEMMLDKLEGGNLHEFIRDPSSDKKKIPLYLKQILEALSYLHNQTPPIVHRDLKPQNIMLDGDRAVLIDFEGSEKVTPSFDLRSVIGTPGFISPEINLGYQQDPLKSDIWSFGVTLYYVLTGKSPFEGRIENGEINFDCLPKKGIIEELRDKNPEAAAVVEACFKTDLRERPTAEQLLQMPYFAQIQ